MGIIATTPRREKGTSEVSSALATLTGLRRSIAKVTVKLENLPTEFQSFEHWGDSKDEAVDLLEEANDRLSTLHTSFLNQAAREEVGNVS